MWVSRLKCRFCGGPLMQPRGAGRRRKWCSESCRLKAYRVRVSAISESGASR